MKYFSNGEQVIAVKISMLILEVILTKEHYHECKWSLDIYHGRDPKAFNGLRHLGVGMVIISSSRE